MRGFATATIWTLVFLIIMSILYAGGMFTWAVDGIVANAGADVVGAFFANIVFFVLILGAIVGWLTYKSMDDRKFRWG